MKKMEDFSLVPLYQQVHSIYFEFMSDSGSSTTLFSASIRSCLLGVACDIIALHLFVLP